MEQTAGQYLGDEGCEIGVAGGDVRRVVAIVKVVGC